MRAAKRESVCVAVGGCVGVWVSVGVCALKCRPARSPDSVMQGAHHWKPPAPVSGCMMCVALDGRASEAACMLVCPHSLMHMPRSWCHDSGHSPRWAPSLIPMPGPAWFDCEAYLVCAVNRSGCLSCPTQYYTLCIQPAQAGKALSPQQLLALSDGLLRMMSVARLPHMSCV